jgi:hypothetical protein
LWGGDNWGRILYSSKASGSALRLLSSDGVPEALGVDSVPGRFPLAASVGADGFTRVLWWKASDRTFLVRWYNANGSYANITQPGPMGHQLPTGWTVVDMVTDGSNNTRVLSSRADGTIQIHSVNGSTGAVTFGAPSGPYSGFTNLGIGVGGNGISRVLSWNKTTRQVFVRTFNSAGTFVSSFQVATPLAGYTPIDIVTGTDNRTHLMYGKLGVVQVHIWSANLLTQLAFGSRSMSGFSGVAIGVGSDNLPRLLWLHPDSRSAYTVLSADATSVVDEDVYQQSG